MKIYYNILLAVSLLVFVACASMGTPDGGPYDEEPPVLMEAKPAIGATNVKTGKITLDFDENIKLVNAFEKVVVSPYCFKKSFSFLENKFNSFYVKTIDKFL